jgi:hypothetical protein
MCRKALDDLGDECKEQIFIAPETLWLRLEGTREGYCVRPCLDRSLFDDAARNTLGYTLQFGVLYAL